MSDAACFSKYMLKMKFDIFVFTFELGFLVSEMGQTLSDSLAGVSPNLVPAELPMELQYY